LNDKQLIAIAIIGAAFTPGGLFAADMSGEREFQQRGYLGLGIGISRLKPESSCNCYEVDDDNDFAGILHAGIDLSPRFTLEGYYANLGEAGIGYRTTGQHAGDVEYKHYGVSLLGYLYNSKDAADYADSSDDDEGFYRREGLSLFGRIGLGKMDNRSNLDYRQNAELHLHLGVGAEYGWANGFAARAEFVSYDKDAKLLSLSLIKRFGKATAPMVAAAPAAVVEEPAAMETNAGDTADNAPSGDGSGEAVEARPGTGGPRADAAIVPAHILSDLDLPVVYFSLDGDDLTPQSKKDLEPLVDTLKKYPSMQVDVEGHTDSLGSTDYNMELSRRRAEQVIDYLVGQGVSRNQLVAKPFGESMPVADNSSEDGRRLNRRVTFSIKKY